MRKIIQIIFILMLIIAMAACSSKGSIKVGSKYQGGIIFYILVAGDVGYDANVPHGLIASTKDQSTDILWSTGSNALLSVPDTLTSIGSGKANTDKIIAQNGTGLNYAAALARAYKGGGYSDWYLPSKDELNLLYLARKKVGGFGDYYYWSSSEYFEEFVWLQNFNLGNLANGGKNYGNRVRAIRSF